MSLLKFLKAAGGLRETDSFRGELRGIGLSPRTLPGIINNKTGLDLDEAALRATEQGFFPERERASPDELLAALDEEINLGRPLFSVVEDDLVFELRALEELAETLDRFEIDVRLPDAAIERQLRALAQGFDELLAPGGQEVSRTLSDITREAEAMRAAGAVEDLADDADVIAALSQDLERLLARQKDFSIPVGVELDPRTGELVTVTRRLSAVIEDLDADDAFNVQLKECAGL